jgi:regulatory protein
MLVRTRHAERGLAGQALAVELRRRGIGPDQDQAAMAQVTAEDEAAAAERLAAKKLAATRGLDRDVRLRRTVGMLGRKGYPPGMALEVVKRLLEAEGGSASTCGGATAAGAGADLSPDWGA